jgi:HEAT repeat protein
MTTRHIYLNLTALGVLMALLGLVYWQHTGARAVPGLMEDLRSEDRQAQQLAALHLKDIGLAAKPAVPLLIELATSDDRSRLHSEAAAALPTINLIAARQVMTHYLPKLQDQDAQIKLDAVSALEALGPIAKPAVPSLIGIMNDPDSVVRDRVVRALGAIGIPADTVMRGLIEALRDPEWTVRYAAVTQFAFSGFSSPDSLAALRDLTKDPNRTVAGLAQSAVNSVERQIQASTYVFMLNQGTNRTYTLHQLAKLGPRAAETVPAVAAVLTAEQPLERYLAACALGSIGPAAKEAVTALQQAAQDPDPIVRESVHQALQSIAHETSTTP